MISGQITHSRLQDAVIAALEEAIRDEADVLATGIVADWSEYRARRGRIDGLRLAIDIAQEAELKFRGE